MAPIDPKQAARSYLSGSDSSWLVLAERISHEISRQGMENAADEGSSEIQLSKDLVLPCLLVPSLVRSISELEVGSLAEHQLALQVHTHLLELERTHGNDGRSHLKEIDVGTRIIDVSSAMSLYDPDYEDDPYGDYNFRDVESGDLASSLQADDGKSKWSAYPDFDYSEFEDPPEARETGLQNESDSLLRVYEPQPLGYSTEDLAYLIGSVLRHAVPGDNEASPKRIIRLKYIDPVLYDVLLSNPELLKQLDWRVFEKLLADVLDRFGYEVELQKGTKDGGVDILAMKRQDPLGTHRYLLQAKRYKNKVGIEPVRQLLFLHGHHRATKSCLATTAAFTSGAWDLARQYQWQLELRDQEGLMEWLRLAAVLRDK